MVAMLVVELSFDLCAGRPSSLAGFAWAFEAFLVVKLSWAMEL